MFFEVMHRKDTEGDPIANYVMIWIIAASRQRYMLEFLIYQ